MYQLSYYNGSALFRPPAKQKSGGERMVIFSYLSVQTFVLDAQKNRLIETVLLSTHNICFG